MPRVSGRAEHPATLLVITTDHATGNAGLNGMGDTYKDSNARFRNLFSIRQSIPELSKRLLADASASCGSPENTAEYLLG